MDAVSGGYIHPSLEPSLVSHGGLSMMGIVSNEFLSEGQVVIHLPRSAFLDLELFKSMPEDVGVGEVYTAGIIKETVSFFQSEISTLLLLFDTLPAPFQFVSIEK